jgi:type VI secretion system protein ImpC
VTAPRVVAVLGRFGGTAVDRPTGFLRVDRDQMARRMGQLGVVLKTSVANHLSSTPGDTIGVTLHFEQLDDFRPEAIVRRVPPLAALLERRRHPAASPRSAALAPTAADLPSPSPPRSPGSLLDTILDADTASEAAAQEVSDLARRVAQPFVERGDPEAERAWRELIDALLGAQVGAILHAPAFQALEAAWRGLHEIVSAAETGECLRILMADVPPAQAAEVIAEHAATPGSEHIAAFVTDYVFGPGEADESALRALARAAERAGAPLVAGAAPAGDYGILDTHRSGV